MKLHLPLSFRKALLACLASLIAPTITLASGAYAAEQLAFSWKDGKFGKSTEAEANIVYRSTPDANGLRLAYLPREAVLGDGNASKVYHWDLNNFGKYEAFHDGTGNKHEWVTVNDPARPDVTGEWVETDTLLHYGEIFDENGLPQKGIGMDEYRWALKEGAGDNGVRFKYDNANMQTNRWVDGNGSSVSGTFEGLNHGDDATLWEKKFSEIVSIQSNKGGAVENTGNLDGISAYFVDNSSLSRLHVKPNSTYIDLSGKNALANEALGGAIYNAGTISGSITGGFAGNISQSETIMEASVYFQSASDVLDLTSLALGGAIYNKGNIGGGISGDFVSNSAYAFHWPKGGVNWSKYATENIVLAAKGGAIFNTSAIDAISGNYVGNSAISQLTMAPHGSASYAIVNGVYSATGGAIYNGIDGLISTATGDSKIGDIKADFIGNYAYNYHFTQQQGYSSSSAPASAYATIKTYAVGGAIFNGIENFDSAANRTLKTVSSKIGDIQGFFIDNYVYDVDPYVCGEHFHPEKSDTNPAKDYKHFALGDYFTHKRHHALGGAIFNGMYGGEVDGVKISSTIGSESVSISGDFVGNYAYAKTHKTLGLDTIGNNDGQEVSTLTMYASGGAIYNGLQDITVGNDGSIQSVIKGDINAVFTGNYAYVYRQLGGDFALNSASDAGVGFSYDKEGEYALGGAIYNGVADIITASDGEALSAIKGTIRGHFTDNYASVESSSNLAHTFTMGGAVYNGINYTWYGDKHIEGDIKAEIQGVDNAFFEGNEAKTVSFFSFGDRKPTDKDGKNKKDFALGGAIYSGIMGITGDSSHTAGNLTVMIGAIGSIGQDNETSVKFVDNLAHTYNEMTGSNSANMAHFAYGGAIYNGIERINDDSTGTSTTASITQIAADFQGNRACTETRYDGVYHALGGAVYNGINDAHVSDGSVAFSSTIEEGISGIFDKNAAINTTSAQYGKYHAFGGAIYNGLTNVSPGEDSVSFVASIGDIGSEEYKSAFEGNYATNSSTATALGEEYLASGGAIYNGIGTIANQTSPQTIYASVGNITADFKDNYAGIGGAADDRQVTQKALGGAIYNRIGSIDGRGDDISNRLQKSGYSYIYTGACRWEDNVQYPYNSKFMSTFLESGKYTNVGTFASNFYAELKDPKFEEDNLPLNAIPKDQLDTERWKKFEGNVFVHGEVVNAPGISAEIGNITGNFEGNRTIAREYASGGALENGIDGIRGSSSSIFNEAPVRMESSVEVSKDAQENILVELERVLEGEYIAPTEITNSITNRSGDISASFGDIHGIFSKNGVSAFEANGGAISNGLNEFSAGSIYKHVNEKDHKEDPTNLLSAAHCYYTKINTNGSSIDLHDTIISTFSIDSTFTAEIANIEGGSIRAFMGNINGEFSGNYATGTAIAKGGAIYNRLSTIAGGSGTISNMNGKSAVGGDATFYYGPADYYTITTFNPDGSRKTEYIYLKDTKFKFRDDVTDTHLINNNTRVLFNNGDDVNKVGGIVGVEIKDISANFTNNYAEGKVALGGAIYNGIEKLSGGTGKIENENNIVYYYNTAVVYDPSARLSFEGDNNITYRITNDYQAGISNINGEIKSVIGNITGDFKGNHVGQEVDTNAGKVFASSNANGGAINNSLGDLNAGSISIKNINLIKYSYNDSASAAFSDIASFSGQDVNTAEIVNTINVAINNQHGTIQSKIGSIDGSFEDNYAVGESANGGAIFNSIAKLSAATIDIQNTFSESYLRSESASDIMKKLKDGLVHNSSSIKNNIEAGFDNSNEGSIEAAIGTISGDIFKGNKAEGGTEANGGAIYNGMDKLLGVDIVYKAGQGLSDESIEASFNNSNGGKIRVSVGNISSDFDENHASVRGQGEARGGAIYNGIGNIGDNVKIKNTNGGELVAETGTIDGSFSGNFAESANGVAEGGAIYNGIGAIGEKVEIENDGGGVLAARIGSINGSFSDNRATAESGEANGGAIYNGIGESGSDLSAANADGGMFDANIKSITGNFSRNKATSTDGKANGGAIYNSGSIGNITGDFLTNAAEGAEAKGGAIYNTGSIGEIRSTANVYKEGEKSGFSGNTATTSGGAIQNEGSIEGIVNENFTGNSAEALGSALTNIGTIGTIADDATAEREYDNTLVSGIVNSSFTGNTGAEAKAALYTETSLAIIADASQAGNAHVVFEKNTNGGKDSDIYVGRGQDGEMADVYMVATKGSSISTYGEINGDGLYTLRLRGFAERADDLYATHGGANNSNPNYEENGNVNFPGGGLINFQGLVKNANVIMDDVTLKLGTAKSGEEYLTVYEDTITRMNDDHELHPGEILFDGSGGNVSYDDRSKAEGYQREYSDVLRGSRLEARSGHVLANHVADGVLTNYNFGTLVSYGSLSYDPSVENGGYYTDGSVNQNLNTEDERNPLYATWSISLSLSQLNANTITTWVRENDPQTTRGYVTLSGITVLTDHINCDKDTEPFEKWWKEQVENDSISPYLDVTIQVINLRREGEENRTLMDDNDPWRREGDINHSAPLQLDLSLLKQKNEAVAFMDSNDILCEGFGYATTKTYHDSIRLWGWRDNLAAWTELKLNAREVGPNGYEKEFHIIGTHQLTRNIRRIENEALGKDTLLQGTNLMIYGNGYETTTLDVNNKNLLSEIAAGQTLELKDMSIINVGNNHIDNQGTLIMDTLAVENALVVNNDNVTIKRGDWGIAHTFTSSQRSSDTKLAAKAGLLYEAPLRVGQASAGKDSTGISNELHLQAGVSVITGTVEYQNIYHEEGAETHFMVHQEADKRGKQEADDSFTSAEGVTSAFRNFYGNSLTMQGGDFYLYNLNLSELKLRELSISDGTIHLNAVTVKLDASEKEGTMGRIWAFDNAEYTGSGHILVEANALQLIRKDGKGELRSGDDRYYEGGEHYAIPVQFVNPEVAASVIPFGKENDYAEGADGKLSTAYKMEAAKFVYDVDYDYETGVYTYRRPVEPKHDDFTPDAITGPVAQAAGAVASMMFLNQYVFQHADLFSANMNRAREARLRDQSHNTVTPVKGYKGATPAAPKAACTDQPVAFKGGMWVRPYAGYEKLPLHKGPKVSNRLYGAIVGGDTDVTEYDSGWASVFSAHAAYMGSTQRFSGRLSGARIQQNGGAVGVTETLYKGKFYTALSATIGTSSGHASTSAGSENFRMVLGGVASRSGYSFELDRGKYIVQPTLLVSYSMVNTSSYTNASGSRIASSPLHTIQVHPYVKVVMNTDSCWQPYLTLGYVHHFMGKTKFRADDVSLPGMSINPYVEYSVGVQRTWADRYTIFGEIIGRNGGRNGVEANVGIRWTW